MHRYIVEVNGRRMALADFSREIGVEYCTMLTRAKRGKQLVQPQKTWARAFSETPTEKMMDEKTGKVGAYADGYTFDELAELYKNFAGQDDEVQMIMDFTGVQKRTAEKLRNKLRENAAIDRRAIA